MNRSCHSTHEGSLKITPTAPSEKENKINKLINSKPDVIFKCYKSILFVHGKKLVVVGESGVIQEHLLSLDQSINQAINQSINSWALNPIRAMRDVILKKSNLEKACEEEQSQHRNWNWQGKIELNRKWLRLNAIALNIKLICLLSNGC